MSDTVVSGSVDKRQKIKKDQAAEHRRKYDSRRIYLRKSWDEWERQRANFRQVSLVVCCSPTSTSKACGRYVPDLLTPRCADHHHRL